MCSHSELFFCRSALPLLAKGPSKEAGEIASSVDLMSSSLAGAVKDRCASRSFATIKSRSRTSHVSLKYLSSSSDSPRYNISKPMNFSRNCLTRDSACINKSNSLTKNTMTRRENIKSVQERKISTGCGAPIKTIAEIISVNNNFKRTRKIKIVQRCGCFSSCTDISMESSKEFSSNLRLDRTNRRVARPECVIPERIAAKILFVDHFASRNMVPIPPITLSHSGKVQFLKAFNSRKSGCKNCEESTSTFGTSEYGFSFPTLI